MSPKFLLAQLIKFVVFTLLFLELSAFSFISNLDIILKAERNRFFEKTNYLNYIPAVKEDLKNNPNISIDQDFLISVMLRLAPYHKKLLNKQSACSLYSYLISGLAQSALGEMKNIVINYPENDKLKSSIISTVDFYEIMIKNPCPKVLPVTYIKSVKEFREYLVNLQNLVPQKAVTCEEEYTKLLQDYQTFNLCSIYDQLKNEPTYASAFHLSKNLLSQIKKSITPQDVFFLDNLCLSAKDEKQFCTDIFEANYWQRISQGKAPMHPVREYCSNDAKKIKGCLEELTSQPQTCHYPQYLKSSLLPAMNCDHISLALNHSVLNTNYPECPLQLENEGIVNATRLLAHLENKNYPFSDEACLSYPLSLFAHFNLELGNPMAWDYQLCYFDRLDQVDKCYPSIIGVLKDSDYSQEFVITNLLRKNSVISDKMECSLIKDYQFNPYLLKYKSGCYILSNLENCSLSECEFKIINNEQTIDIIKVKPPQLFDYISHTRDNRNFSQVNLITEQLKKQSKEIRNLSVLKSFFQNHPNSIIHGVGCAQTLLPSFFKMQSLYQCDPMPFILDGVFTKNGETLITLRTAIDHLHAPRLTNWKRIYSSIKMLHDIHPQKSWSLYGLY